MAKRHVLRAIVTRPGWLIAFALGVLTGVVLCMPLGWTLPGSSAELIGGAIGALIAIGGAVLVWQLQESERVDTSAVAIKNALLPSLAMLDRLADTNPNDHGALLHSLDLAKAAVAQSREFVALFGKDILTDPGRHEAYQLIRVALDSSFEDIRHGMTSPGLSGKQTVDKARAHFNNLDKFAQTMMADD